jgi:hypothetical protein
MMSLRSFFLALAVAALSLLLVAGSGAYWLYNHSPLSILGGTTSTYPQTTLFIPKSAPAMASLLVNPERVDNLLRVLVAPENRRQIHREWQNLEQNLLFKTGWEYQRDIAPWLGDETTIAVTTADIDRDASNGQMPGYLLATTTKNNATVQDFLQSLLRRGKSPAWSEHTYKGVRLFAQPSLAAESEVSTHPTEQMAVATVANRFVLLANHPQVIRDAVDSAQVSNLSLASDRNYQQTLAQLAPQKVGVAFGNLPQLTAWLGNEAALRSSADPYEKLGLALELKPAGMIWEIAATGPLKTASQQLPLLSEPVTALQYLPANSNLAIGSRDLRALWQQLQPLLQSDSTLAETMRSVVGDLQRRWGVDLEEEIFRWYEGDYALGVANSHRQNQQDWVFVAQADRQQADTIAEHLNAIAKANGYTLGKVTLQEQPVYAWTQFAVAQNPIDGTDPSRTFPVLSAREAGVYTYVDGYQILASSLEAMNAALQAPGNSTLASPEFQASIAPFRTPNQGYAYINWQTIRPNLEKQFPAIRWLENAASPVSQHLRSLTASSYGIQNGVFKGRIFLRLTAAQ